MRRYVLNGDNNSYVKIERGFDVMIFGGGLAGLYAALTLDGRFSVAVAAKSDLKHGSSWYAQGGIASALAPDDSPEQHVADTLKAGAGLCDERAVRVLAKEGPGEIRRLEALGVPFDRDGEGNLLLTKEGGHRRNRIVHCGGDATGRETVKRLGKLITAHPNVTLMPQTFLLDVATDDRGVTGVFTADREGIHYYPCANVILATGGIGQVYKYTTNPTGAFGDGIAAAVRAHAEAERMEFVQFHPTTLIPEGRTERLFLISEAVRGEGGVLRDSGGCAFMKGVHELCDLAPRDVVTRAIMNRLAATGDSFVYLDVSAIGEEYFKERFPTIYTRCKEYGIDVPRAPIPVRPGQHYMMGGIKTDLSGATRVAGLYACGETASTGVHGANRLASNSMLECLVFGRRCAESVNAQPRSVSKSLPPLFDAPEGRALPRTRVSELRSRIKEKMSKYVGAARTEEGLRAAKRALDAVLDEIGESEICDGFCAELYDMACVASMVTDAAINRKESIGAHFLADGLYVK